MTNDQMKIVLDRVLTWSLERQQDVARLLTSMESQDENAYRLADDQIDEIERRRSDQSAKTLTLGQFNRRFSRPE